MANDPFLGGPPLLVPVDPVQVHEPVKVGLEVLGPHAGETPDARVLEVHLVKASVRRTLERRSLLSGASMREYDS